MSLIRSRGWKSVTLGLLLAWAAGSVMADPPHARQAARKEASREVRGAVTHANYVRGSSSKAEKKTVSAKTSAGREPIRYSEATRAGLGRVRDPLSLRSSVAYVIDQRTHEVLFSKNEDAVLPIASLTKLMTAILVREAGLPLDEKITITQDDVDTEAMSGSRLRVGLTLTRGELLRLALMASENRAAHALGRTYPGGMGVFVDLMNAKAKILGMEESRFVEPTGLSSGNRSSARDLALLVDAASHDELLREYSTSRTWQVEAEAQTKSGKRNIHKMQFANTNRLVRNPNWDIGLQKTGYIAEAGQCLVMQATIAGRPLIMVFLDSAGKLSRIGDANRVRRWLEGQVQASAKAQPET